MIKGQRWCANVVEVQVRQVSHHALGRLDGLVVRHQLIQLLQVRQRQTMINELTRLSLSSSYLGLLFFLVSFVQNKNEKFNTHTRLVEYIYTIIAQQTE